MLKIKVTKTQGRMSCRGARTRFERKKASIPEGDPGSLPGDDDIDLYVLNLQEVVDIGSASEALRPYTDQLLRTNGRTQ